MSEKKGFLGSLFGGKKGNSGSSCSGVGPVETYAADKRDKIGSLTSVKVLGPGCKNCHSLLESAQAALKEIGSMVAVEYVTDMATVASYGVMSTPALVVNEKVVSMGKVIKARDIVKLIQGIGI